MEIIMTEMLWAAVLLVVGFVLLIKGADFFVEGSSSVAKMLKVPSIIIGLTIVAMGTSLPECAVSITASVTNNNALAVSNAIGSIFLCTGLLLHFHTLQIFLILQ